MPSNARRIFSGMARRQSGLCAFFLLLSVSSPSHAQPAEDEAQAQPTAAPNSVPADSEASARTSDPGTPTSPSAPSPAALPQVAVPPSGSEVPALELGSSALATPPSTSPANARAAEAEPTRTMSLGAAMAVSHISENGSSGTVATPILQALFAPRPYAGIEIEWPLALMLDSEGLGSATARSGNPHLGAWYRRDSGSAWWRVGMAITAPIARVNLGDDGRLQRQLYSQGAAAWGMWDDWRWATGRLAIPLSGSLSYDLDDDAALVVDASVGPIFGVSSGESGTDLLAQIAVGIRVRVANTFWLTPRVQTVLLPSASVDRLQTAAVLRADWASAIGKLFLGILVNLDEPLGVFGRGTQAWGIHFGKELDL